MTLSQRALHRISTRPLRFGIERRQPSLILVVHAVSQPAQTPTALLDRIAEPNVSIGLDVLVRLVKLGVIGSLDETGSIGGGDVVVEGGRGSARLGSRGLPVMGCRGNRFGDRSGVEEGCRGKSCLEMVFLRIVS